MTAFTYITGCYGLLSILKDHGVDDDMPYKAGAVSKDADGNLFAWIVDQGFDGTYCMSAHETPREDQYDFRFDTNEEFVDWVRAYEVTRKLTS